MIQLGKGLLHWKPLPIDFEKCHFGKLFLSDIYSFASSAPKFFFGKFGAATAPKIWINPTQNGGPIQQHKFQHSSSIRKCIKIKGIESTFGGLCPPLLPEGGPYFKNSKKPHTEKRWSHLTPKISAL